MPSKRSIVRKTQRQPLTASACEAAAEEAGVSERPLHAGASGLTHGDESEDSSGRRGPVQSTA